MTNTHPFLDVFDTIIPNGATNGIGVYLGASRLWGFTTPAVMTGSTISWEMSFDSNDGKDGTWLPVKELSTNAQLSGTIDTGQANYYGVEALVTSGCPWVRPVSGSAEGAERAMKVVAMPIASTN